MTETIELIVLTIVRTWNDIESFPFCPFGKFLDTFRRENEGIVKKLVYKGQPKGDSEYPLSGEDKAEEVRGGKIVWLLEESPGQRRGFTSVEIKGSRFRAYEITYR